MGFMLDVLLARCVHVLSKQDQEREDGSAGEAAEGVVQLANAGASLGAQAVRDGGLYPAIHLFRVYKRHVR